MPFSAFHAGIDDIFLFAQQPGEVRVAGAELIEPRLDPSQHLVDFVAFRDDAQLRVESAQEAVGRHLLAGQHIAADIT